MSTRAVSTTLGYVLTLSITTILISGIMVGAGGYVSAEHERVTETELEVVGQRLAANIEAVDRIASSSDDETTSTVSSRLELPNRVAGTTYRISVEPDDDGSAPYENELVLRSVDPEITVHVIVETSVELDSGSVDAGDVVVRYDGTVEVTNG